MAVNSRQKGSSYERVIARLFEVWSGSSVKRTPLSGGWAKEAAFEAKADLVSTDKKFPFSVECKKREGWVLEHLLYTKTEVFQWWEQTVKESPMGKIPLLVFSKNRSKNFAMLSIAGWRKVASTRRPRGKWMMVKTKKTGLCYILILDDLLKQIPYESVTVRCMPYWKKDVEVFVKGKLLKAGFVNETEAKAKKGKKGK